MTTGDNVTPSDYLEKPEIEDVELEFPLFPSENLTTKEIANQKYSEKTWKTLAIQHPVIKRIAFSLKSTSDMTWKVAVSGAFALLTGFTKRRQYIDYEQGPTHLNLITLLVGDSGWTRKTTCRSFVKKMFEKLKPAESLPPKFTPEGLLDQLKNADQHDGMVIADELGFFFKLLQREYMAHAPDTISELYDCGFEVSSATKNGGKVTIKKPYFRMFGAGTEEITKHLDDEYFKQGFLPRILFFIDNEIEDRKLRGFGFHAKTNKKDIKFLEEDLKKMKSLPVTKLKARVKPQIFKDFEDYCFKKMKYHKSDRGEKLLLPLYSRLPTQCLKIAGVLQVSYMAHVDSKKKEVILLPEWISLAVKFIKLLESDYIYLVYLYQTSAPSVKHTTEERRLAHVQRILKQNEGVMSLTRLHKSTNIMKDDFMETVETLTSMDLVYNFSFDKEWLVKCKILESESDPFPFAGRPPELVYHKEFISQEYGISLHEGDKIQEMATKIFVEKRNN